MLNYKANQNQQMQKGTSSDKKDALTKVDKSNCGSSPLGKLGVASVRPTPGLPSEEQSSPSGSSSIAGSQQSGINTLGLLCQAILGNTLSHQQVAHGSP
jgi:hypothetical protein